MSDAESAETLTKETMPAHLVVDNVNAILKTLMSTLQNADVSGIRLGKPRACRDGWKSTGFAVHSYLRGMLSGDIVFGADFRTAHETTRRFLSKKFPASDSEVRLTLQMLANEALVAASEIFSRLSLRVSFTAPQVYGRFEWSKASHVKTPMIEIPLITRFGVFQLAFNINTTI